MRRALNNVSGRALILCIVTTAFVAAILLLPSRTPQAALTPERARVAYGEQPMSFEANAGQTDERVRFFARGSGYTLYLTPTEAVLALQRTEAGDNASNHAATSNTSRARNKKAPRDKSPAMQRASVSMQMVGANPAAEIAAQNEQAARINYFIGDDPAKWRTDIKTYASVRYAGVYDGIDAVYYGTGQRLEYDFIVRPNIDPAQIKLQFTGADRIELDDASGDLVLHTELGAIRQHKPVVYQMYDGARHEIASRYRLEETSVSFELGDYDTRRELVIDPVFSYGRTLGGFSTGTGSGDGASDVAVDAAGFAYLTGTSCFGVPTTIGAYDRTLSGCDTFVTKLDPNGQIIYSTYVGGASGFGSNGNDLGFGIALDADKNAYITGTTDSGSFPTTTGAFDTTVNVNQFGNSLNGFVTKLNPTGTALVYSTYLGGNNFNGASDIALDSANNAYIVGRTEAQDFPVTIGAYDTTHNDSSGSGKADGYVTKLNAAGSALIYSTFLGGSGNLSPLGRDSATSIAVDVSGAAYVTGLTTSPNFPVTSGAYNTASGDTFVTKLAPDGASLAFSTFLGTSGDNAPSPAVAIDSTGNSYVLSATGVHTAGAFDGYSTSTGLRGLSVTKFAPSGASLIYSARIGFGVGDAITVDADGLAYITGGTTSTAFPTTADAYDRTLDNANNPGGAYDGDAFVTVLNATGSALTYSTYFGGATHTDGGSGIGIDADKGIYIVGGTNAYDLPDTNFTRPRPSDGAAAAFAAKFGTTPAPRIDFLVSGRIILADGSGADGITVNLGGGFGGGTTITAAGGYYSFTNIRGGFDYEVVTVNNANFTVNTPRTILINDLRADRTDVNFTARRLFTISGQVTDTNGNPLANTTIGFRRDNTTLTSVTTDGQGRYTRGELLDNNNYTVTPFRTNYTFNPAERSYPNLSANQTADFVGTPPVIISGRITKPDLTALAFAQITLNCTGVGNQFLQTNQTGNYSVEIPSGRSCTLTPTFTGYRFEPVSASFTNLATNATYDFTGIPPVSITGRITKPDNSALTFHNVRITNAANEFITSVNTDSTGHYTFNNLINGGSYIVKPQDSLDYDFVPLQRTYINLTVNITDGDFATTPAAVWTISGTIVDASGAPMSGVTVRLSGNATAEFTTGADGTYSFPNLKRRGAYSVAPSKTGFAFRQSNPPFGVGGASASYNSLSQNETANFTGRLLHTVSGRVVDLDGVAIRNVQITISNPELGYYFYGNTDTNGNYTVTGVVAGSSYTVQPSRSNYAFQPSTRTIDNINSNLTGYDFVGGTPVVITIYATDELGDAIPNTPVNLSGSSTETLNIVNGQHTFNAIRGGSYTFTPVKPGATFIPASVTLTNVTASQTITLSGTLTPALTTNLAGCYAGELLDTAFGDCGRIVYGVTRTGTHTVDAGRGVALDAQDRLVIAATVTYSGFNPKTFQTSQRSRAALVRLNSDGTLDATFGTNGIAVATSTTFDDATDVLIQTDGKIVVGGNSGATTTSPDFAILRFNQDGTPDTSFGTNGKVTSNIRNGYDQLLRLALAPDNKIIAAGYATNYNFVYPIAADLVVARYTDAGTLDTTFGAAGKLTYDRAGNFDSVSAISFTRDSRIMLAGVVTGSDGKSLGAFLRLNQNGTYDTTFGANSTGIVTTDKLIPTGGIHAQPGNLFVVAGTTGATPNTNIAIARFRADGTLDPNFGTAGITTTDFFGNDDAHGFAFLRQRDGKFVIGGYARRDQTTNFTRSDFALARYTPTGAPDATFGNAGKVTTDFNNSLATTGTFTDAANDLLIQADGKLVLVGDTSTPNSVTLSDIAIARYATTLDADLPEGNTQPGTNVTVNPGGGVSLTFDNVTAPGETSVKPIDPTSAGSIPPGYFVAPGGIAYEITTDATFTGSILIKFNTPQSYSPAAFAQVRILHGEGNPRQLVDRTVLAPDVPAPDYPTRAVHARVTSLSPFVLATTQDVSQIVTLTPTADTYVVGADANRNTNYGAGVEMQVKRTLNPGAGRGRRMYLKFDLAGVTTSVRGARLRLFAHLSDSSLANVPLRIQKVADAGTFWDEMTMTWNTQPDVASPNPIANDVLVLDSTGRYYEYDLTSFIQAELSAGRNVVSFRIINMVPTGINGSYFTSFNSKEAAENKPQLVIEP